jgi:hypothetical protein
MGTDHTRILPAGGAATDGTPPACAGPYDDQYLSGEGTIVQTEVGAYVTTPQLRVIQRHHAAEAYARFYAPLAVAAILVTFLPLYNDYSATYGAGAVSVSFGTVWDMAGRYGGDPARLGLAGLAVIVALLVRGAFVVRSALLPSVLAVLGAAVVVLVIAAPGTGPIWPGLAEGGYMAITVGGLIVLTSLAHAVHVGLVLRPD